MSLQSQIDILALGLCNLYNNIDKHGHEPVVSVNNALNIYDNFSFKTLNNSHTIDVTNNTDLGYKKNDEPIQFYNPDAGIVLDYINEPSESGIDCDSLMNCNIHFTSDSIIINNLTCLCTTDDEIKFYQKIITQAGLTTTDGNFGKTTTYLDTTHLKNLCFKIIDTNIHKIQPLPLPAARLSKRKQKAVRS